MPLEIAERIAYTAHAGQIEKLTKTPYINHVIRVVALVEGHDAKVAAWLHDVLEDTEWSTADLLELGIPSSIVHSVEILTKYPAEDYSKYIDRIMKSGDEIAIAVKTADLIDHLRPNCPQKMREKYEAALVAMRGVSSAAVA